MPRDGAIPYSARPTLRLEGTEYPLLSRNVHRMVMREQTGGLSTLELSLIDWIATPDGRAGYGAVGDSPLKLGRQISVYAGDATGPQEIFAGRIVALEAELRRDGAPLITVIAEDALFLARRRRRRRLLEDASPADVVRTIAGDHGLRPEIRDGLDAPVRDWMQMNESDLAFLRRVLAMVDADLQMVGDAMQVGPRARDARTELALAYPRDLISARITADLAEQVTALTLSGFDAATGEAVEANAAERQLGPGSGEDGASVLGRAFDAVEDHLGFEANLAQAEADAFVAAAARALARRFVRVDATTQGHPELRVGSWVSLDGVNPAFANVYCVTAATHRFDDHDGYLTDFRAESGYLGETA
jgi:phage protein D